MYQFIKLCKPDRFNHIIYSLIIFLLVTTRCITHVYADEATSVTTSHNIIHKHSGSSSGGGGCYKKAVTETIILENRCKGELIYFSEWNKTQCNICGASYDGNDTGRACYTTNPTQTTRTTYSLSCGHDKNELMGFFEGTIDTSEWAREVILTLSISKPELATSDNPFLINDNSIVGNTYIIRENNSYSSTVSLNKNSSVEPIIWNIKNIDNTAPALDITYDQTADIEASIISVNAVDLQPDGTEGCGLAPIAYSFDGGENWDSSPEYKATQNGEYNICVRDALDNIACSTITIDNIKPPAPPKIEQPKDSSPDEKPNTTPDSGKEPSSPEINNINPDYIPETVTTPPATDSTPVPDESSSDPIPSQKPVIPTKDTESNNDSDKITEPDRTGIIPFPIPTPVTYKKTIPVNKKKYNTMQEPAEIVALEEPIENNNIENYAFILLLILFGLLLLLALLFLLYRITRIYNYKGNDQYAFIGISFIKYKEDIFSTEIDESIVDKCDTNLLMIKPSILFYVLHKEEDITIYLPDKQAHQSQIVKNIKVKLKSKA